MSEEQQKFKQLDLFAIDREDSVIVVGIREYISSDDAKNLKEELDKRLPKGCHSIIVTNVSSMTYVPGS